MAAALKTLLDKRQLRLTKAKLRAWWEGEEFDKEAALREIEANLANDPGDGGESELFDEPEFEPAPRLVALSKLWGEGRIRPGDDTLDVLEPARLGLDSDGLLAVMSPGLAAPLVALAGVHPGKIDVFEWRDETFGALQDGVRKAKLGDRVTVARIDLEAHVWPAVTYDGLISIDDFAYAGLPPHLAHRLAKCLKPGACAVIEVYVGLPSKELSTAFASSFAEPQIRAPGDLLQVFADVGFKLESDEDISEEFLDLARQRFKQLADALAEGAIEPAAARELAWEAEAWRMRLKLLAQRRLERHRYVLRRPTEDAAAPEAPPEPAVVETPQSENANAPAG